jgi:CDP-diacylglycerol---glycerol-3-phosphate 3-phosphatidyltransferase
MLVERQSLMSLRRRWLLTALAYTAVLLLGYQWLLQQWQAGRPGQWLVLATITMIIQMAILWWALDQNRLAPDAILLPWLGYANGMTLARGLLTCLLAGFLFAPRPMDGLAWAPALFYTLERLLDYFDGYVARITGHETKLGVILDMEYDSVGFLLAVILAIQYGQLPVWYLVLGLARQLFLLGLWLRGRWGLPLHDYPASEQARLTAGLQTGFLTFVLWPILSPQITVTAAYLFAIPLLYSFGRDWLVVSGVLDPASHSYQSGRRTIKRIFEQWLPLGARLLGGWLALIILWQAAPAFSAWSRYVTSAETNFLSPLLMVLAILWSIVALLLLAGVAGRGAALLLVGLASLDIMAAGWHWPQNGLLLICLLIVVHLGSGRFALWQPEERLLRMKLGMAGVPKR